MGLRCVGLNTLKQCIEEKAGYERHYAIRLVGIMTRNMHERRDSNIDLTPTLSYISTAM
jgi:hypothetical protein